MNIPAFMELTSSRELRDLPEKRIHLALELDFTLALRHASCWQGEVMFESSPLC